MSNWKLKVSSTGEVALEVTAVLNDEERKAVDNLISPEGFIMAQVFKKLRSLDGYIKDLSGQRAVVAEEQPKQEAKKPYGKYAPTVCPVCNNNTLHEYTVKKEGPNKGKKFKMCKTEGCSYRWDWKNNKGM